MQTGKRTREKLHGLLGNWEPGWPPALGGSQWGGRPGLAMEAATAVLSGWLAGSAPSQLARARRSMLCVHACRDWWPALAAVFSLFGQKNLEWNFGILDYKIKFIYK